ncbi:hypothetical protein ILUMI_16421 [Ignelater luminosus]|uniref:THAP-type domain-containing protein n=1 Tax=Ignelater luminosus TaxID=2038154 RepID=A0A8K0G601_IGNLU|nr:hypothetical protein ILUMI_16421 [Ignelater luminosus]
MIRRCCVPGCKSNYDSTRKENSQCITTFSFPKNEDRRKKWIKGIPRKHWTSTVSSVVCCLHFNPEDVIRHDKFLQPDGTQKEISLSHPRLTENAVPCIFPNLPKYLSTGVKRKRKDPESRREDAFQRHSAAVERFLNDDLIKDFSDFKNNFPQKVNMCKWEVKVLENCVYFFTLNYETKLTIRNCERVSEHLTVNIHLNKNELSAADLRWILPVNLKVSKWSQIINILARYQEPQKIVALKM